MQCWYYNCSLQGYPKMPHYVATTHTHWLDYVMWGPWKVCHSDSVEDSASVQNYRCNLYKIISTGRLMCNRMYLSCTQCVWRRRISPPLDRCFSGTIDPVAPMILSPLVTLQLMSCHQGMHTVRQYTLLTSIQDVVMYWLFYDNGCSRKGAGFNSASFPGLPHLLFFGLYPV